MTARGDDAIVARNARNIALSTSLIVFRAVDRAVGRVRPEHRRLPVRRAGPLGHDRRLHDQLPHGDRRHFAVLRAAVDPPDRALRRGELDRRPRPGAGNT